jgi:hypothetical protein
MAQQNSSTPGVDPDLTHVDNVAVPLTSYGQSVPRRKGGPVNDVEGYARPGNRIAVTARAEDPAGASLNIVGSVNRGRTIRSYLEGQPPPYDPAQDRTGMVVAEYRAGSNGQSPVWAKRARQAQQEQDAQGN